MATTLVIGLDGHKSGERVLEYGKRLAGLIKDCELLVVYVVEWSPYSFQTPEENAERRRSCGGRVEESGPSGAWCRSARSCRRDP